MTIITWAKPNPPCKSAMDAKNHSQLPDGTYDCSATAKSAYVKEIHTYILYLG